MLIRDIGSMKWDHTADVVVVGYGSAGAVAAISAHDDGAQVIILEKQSPGEAMHITNSNLSMGGFMCPTNVKDAVSYWEASWKVTDDLYWTEPEIIRSWAEYMTQNKEWVEALGGKLRSVGAQAHYDLPGGEAMEQHLFRGFGIGLHRFMSDQIQQRAIPIIYGARASKLLADLNGRIVGVRVNQCAADGDQRQIDIGASRAVIMTCGGFEFNERMKLNYLKVYPTHFHGAPANTGDGIKMVMEVGADLWHMNCVAARIGAKFPGVPAAFTMDLGGKMNQMMMTVMSTKASPTSVVSRSESGYILVDQDGKRWTNEDYRPHTVYYELALFDTQRLVHPRVPCYWIFDQKRIDSCPLPTVMSGPSGPMGMYKWSNDNKQELEKGWIVQADSVRELAQKLGIGAQNLERTIADYNAYCDHGEDPEYHRNTSGLFSLSNPPFYAVQMWPGGPNTQGGPRRNSKAQLLNVDGDTIRGLYGAGEIGSVHGMLYTGGGNLGECIAFGRIAGENAAREPKA